MKDYFSKYPFSLLITGIILYLSFFTPPATKLDTVTNIDKLVHICMYGGLCCVIWIEYLRAHKSISKTHTIIKCILMPIILSGIIELLQEYATENRSGDWADMLANSFGVLSAAILGYGVFPKWFKEKKYSSNTSVNDDVQN